MTTNSTDHLTPSTSSTTTTDAGDSKKTSPSHVKRPLNAFMVWSKLERQKMLELSPEMHNANISVQLGLKWKELPEEERKPFVAEAERLRKLHLQEHPGYKFQPKKRNKQLTPGKKLKSESKPTSTLEKIKRMLKNSNQFIPLGSMNNSIANSKSVKIVTSTRTDKPQTEKTNPNNSNAKKIPVETSFSKTISKSLSAFEKQIQFGSINNSAFNLKSVKIVTPTRTDKAQTEKTKLFNSNARKKNVEASVSKSISMSSGFEKRITIDQDCREKLRGTAMIPLDQIESNPLEMTCSDNSTDAHSIENEVDQKLESVNTDDDAQTSDVTNFTDLGGSLMSGPLCAIAHASRDEWSDTFDYLVENVIQNTKECKQDIEDIAKQYKLLKKANDSKYRGYHFAECRIPPLSDLLGDRWIDEKNEFNFDF